MGFILRALSNRPKDQKFPKVSKPFEKLSVRKTETVKYVLFKILGL